MRVAARAADWNRARPVTVVGADGWPQHQPPDPCESRTGTVRTSHAVPRSVDGPPPGPHRFDPAADGAYRSTVESYRRRSRVPAFRDQERLSLMGGKYPRWGRAVRASQAGPRCGGPDALAECDRTTQPPQAPRPAGITRPQHHTGVSSEQAYVPAEQPPPPQEARVPAAHAHPGGPCDPRRAPAQGPRSHLGLTRTAPCCPPVTGCGGGTSSP